MIPLPNVTPPPGPLNRENYLINPKLTSNANNYIGRVDWQITPRNSVFVRYSDIPWTRFVPGPFGNSIIDGTGTSAWGRLTMNSQAAAVGWTAMISPTMVNSFPSGLGPQLVPWRADAFRTEHPLIDRHPRYSRQPAL